MTPRTKATLPATPVLDLKLSDCDRREMLNALVWLIGRMGCRFIDQDERNRTYKHTFKLLSLLSRLITYEEADEIYERVNDIVNRMAQPPQRRR